MEKENIEDIEKKLKEVEKEESENKEVSRRNALWRDYNGDDRVVRFKELKKEIDEEGQPPEGIKTNIQKLDFLTEGFEEGQLITVSGITGSGKTSILQSFLIEFAKQKIQTLFFTYEVKPRQFLLKFGNNIPDWSYMPRKHKEFQMQWLEERIIESIAKYNTKVVMIDDLHHLLNFEKMNQFGNNVSLLIGGMVKKLKDIALENNLIIFLVAHTQQPKMEGRERISISSIRDSSFVAQTSDSVFLIRRGNDKDKDINSCQAELSVVKNRKTGKLGKVDLTYAQNQFRETDKNYEKESEEKIDEEDYKKLL